MQIDEAVAKQDVQIKQILHVTVEWSKPIELYNSIWFCIEGETFFVSSKWGLELHKSHLQGL